MTAPAWMRYVLFAAGGYNLVWGSAVVLAPSFTFRYSGLEKPGVPLDYPQLWQCVGMIVGVYGVGYLVASRDPLRHWAVVLVGFLGKTFGPIGAAFGILKGETPPEILVTNVPNDLIWWPFFALILWRAYQSARPGGGA